MTIGRGGDPLLEKGFPAPPKPSPPLPKTFVKVDGGRGGLICKHKHTSPGRFRPEWMGCLSKPLKRNGSPCGAAVWGAVPRRGGLGGIMLPKQVRAAARPPEAFSRGENTCVFLS